MYYIYSGIIFTQHIPSSPHEKRYNENNNKASFRVSKTKKKGTNQCQRQSLLQVMKIWKVNLFDHNEKVENIASKVAMQG